MLQEFERRLTALVGDGLAGRTHLRVVQVPTDVLPLLAGRGAVLVSLGEVGPLAAFQRGQVAIGGTPAAPTSRRVLPIRFSARVEFLLRPPGNDPADLLAGRSLLLEDMSLAGHSLAAPEVRDGSAFQTAGPDSGFEVHGFELERGSPAPQVTTSDTLSGELVYGGEAAIWPPTPPSDEGTILQPDVVLAALPILIQADDPVVLSGTTTRVRIRGIDGRRLVDPATGARGPLELAVRVLSDLPPAERGAILTGADGGEVGLRVIPSGSPETVVEYRAPSGDLGATRLELVAVHLATPEGRSGAFLGSAAIRLRPETPP